MGSRDQRRSPRCTVTFACALRRAEGSAFGAETVNVGTGGALLRTARPLTIDESLGLDIDGVQVQIQAQARVLRHEGPGTYALRFEGMADATVAQLQQLVHGAIATAEQGRDPR